MFCIPDHAQLARARVRVSLKHTSTQPGLSSSGISPSQRNDRNDLCARGDDADAAFSAGGPIIPPPPPPPPPSLWFLPVYRILPPRMLGVLAQKAQMYTWGTSCGVGTSTQRPCSM